MQAPRIEAGPVELQTTKGERLTLALMSDMTISERKYAANGSLTEERSYVKTGKDLDTGI